MSSSSSCDLLTAAKNGYYSQVVSLLSSNSCDVDARDKDKATPLYWSASRGNARICQALLQAGCDVNACVKWGSTALHAAADRGHAECLMVLLNSGADVQVQNERGDTALHLAAYRGYKDLVHLLVNTRRADPFLKNAQSKTPLQEAQSQQHTGATNILQQYMESLGCHRFKSLPTSEGSGKPACPQEQPASSAPAQSWPRYQSFPKFPDPAPPADPSRPHTHPLLVNNLSHGVVGVGGSNLLQGPSRAEAGSETRLNQLTGITGLKGLPGLVAGSGERLQPMHALSDPQEHADECGEWGKVQGVKDAAHSEHHRHGHGVADDWRHESAHPTNGVRLNQLSRPTDGGYRGTDNAASGEPARHCAQSPASFTWRHQNGQDNVNGVNRALSYQTDIHPPYVAPPTHHPQGFLKHEDLTLFAESLQLEVVKLRDSLSGKERYVLELEKQVSSVRTQNTQLQQIVSEQQNESKDMLTTKDSEICELRRSLRDQEKQNECLQRAVAECQTSMSRMSTQRDSQVLELTGRISDLERLNASLQELLMTQQDAMKRVLAGKDQEIAALRSSVADLTQKVAPSPAAPSAHPVTPAAERSAAHEPPVPLADKLHITAEAVVETPAAGGDSQPSSKPAVSSVCDQSSTQPSALTQSARTRTADYLPRPEASRRTAQDGVTFPTSAESPLLAGSPPPCSRSERAAEGLQQCRLRAAVSRQFQESADLGKLDADGREWRVGREFQLLELQPVNCGPDGQRRGACSLVFSIRHQGHKYMLKMLTNLINLSYEGHSQGRSLDAHLLHCFGAEFHAPLLLHRHPNIVRVRHHYQGDTSQFARCLHLLVPPSLDVPVDMARRTTFLVLDHYPMTLQTFMDGLWEEENEAPKLAQDHQRPGGKTPRQTLAEGFQNREVHEEASDFCYLREKQQQFLLQIVYQLLSAVDYLQRHDVVHRDIKADNVFLDWRLRPVLGDFGLARTLRGSGGQALAPFMDGTQVMAGNSHAWAPELCRWSRMDPTTVTQPVTLKDIYSKSDGFAVARMFYHLLHRPNKRNSSENPNNADRNGTEAGGCAGGGAGGGGGGGGGSSSSNEKRFPTSTVQQPHYPDSAVPVLESPVCGPGLAHVLRSLVLDDPSCRPSVRQALCRVGALLFKPDVMLTSEEEAEEFCASQLLALSAVPPTSQSPTPADEETLSLAESVTANQNHCLADFLLNFSGRDFWEAYTEMTAHGLLNG